MKAISRRWCLMMAVAIALPIGPAEAEESLELAVKATYLAKLSPFIVWPGQAAEFPDGAFPICVIGRDPFGSLLDRAVVGQTVGGHSVVVRRLDNVSDRPPCAIAFVSRGSLDAMTTLRPTPVLTVTDQAPDAGPKGVVNFVMQDNRVRFEIDDAAAAQKGLGISSKLLSLAVAVRPRTP